MERERKIHLHWFWRGALAAPVVCIYFFLFLSDVFPWDPAFRPLGEALGLLDPDPNVFWDNSLSGTICHALVFGLPVALLALGTYGLLTRFFGPPVSDGETRCRKCGYILRGISEPRCPECGERI